MCPSYLASRLGRASWRVMRGGLLPTSPLASSRLGDCLVSSAILDEGKPGELRSLGGAAFDRA